MRPVVAAAVLLAIAVAVTGGGAVMDPGDELVMHVVANALGAAGRSVHWDNGSLPCGDWVGVRCDTSARVVVGITAQGFGLNGTLPEEVHYLAALRFLDLRGNRITGPLPHAPFPELRTLLLDRNEFTAVPSNFFAIMPKLATLTLNDNAALRDWKLPGAGLRRSQLQVLQARNASVAGTLSIFLRDGSAFPSLRRVSLPNNRLAGPVPATFASTTLRYLDLSHNRLTGTIDFVSNLPNLEELRLDGNAFTGVLPDFSKLWGLKVVTISRNQFTGVVPASLTNRDALTSVSLANNLFQGPLPEFARCVQTDVAEAASQGSFCRPERGPCEEHVVLLLSIATELQFPVNLATSWRGNDACAGWLGVYCDHNGVIVGMNLSHLGLNGTISPAFAVLSSLQVILLSGNHLTGEVPRSLSTLASLRVLDVADNALEGTMPPFRSSVFISARGNPNLTTVVTSSPAARRYAAPTFFMLAALSTLIC